MSGLIKSIKWGGLFFLALLAIAIAFYTYLVLSFDTENFPENHGQIHSELFKGDGDNMPLVVGFGGSEGGNAWASDFWKPQRDKFVSEGYAFLAIGYFGAPGTPQNLDRIALESVYAEIMRVASDSQINEQCIALIGGSKGAELSLLLGSHYEDIKAVVAIVPGHAVFPALTIAMNTPSFSLNGEPLPFVPIPWSATVALIQGDLRAVWLQMLKNEAAVEDAAIVVENINGPILFVSATEDEFWPSTEMSNAMVARLKKANFSHNVEHIVIDGPHAAPLDHFDKVEAYLEAYFPSNAHSSIEVGDCTGAKL